MTQHSIHTVLEVLEQEVAYYKTLLEPHDTGHIHTTINFLNERIGKLKIARDVIQATVGVSG
jgi:hypothetical protein